MEKYMLIMFLPSCETVRPDPKVTEKDNQRLQWKLQLFGLHFTHEVQTDIWLIFKRMNLWCAMWKGIRSCPKMYFARKQKNWPTASQRMLTFYHKQAGAAELGWSRCFLVKDCAFFPSKWYSWEVGKEHRKLSVMGSTRCLAQNLHRPLLPSEVHYLLKIRRPFQFR